MPEDAPGNLGAVPEWADEESGEPDDELVMRGKVRGMQAKQHRWAGEDSSRRFGDLFNLVCDPDFLAEAWMRVRRNRGAKTPGIDGVTAAHVERRAGGVSGFLAEIRGQLKAGKYRPSEVRQVMIPKTNGKLRKIGIPTLADRVVQASLKLVLEPIFEADFQPCSYGFRESAGINRHGGGDGRALRRRASDPRRPRAMRRRPARAWRSVGRGTCRPGYRAAKSVFRGADAVRKAEGNIAGGANASRQRTPRGRRTRACAEPPCARTGRARARPFA